MASDTLFRNEKIVKILFETTPDMLTILDKDGKILDCNHRFTENFGYDKSEAVGKIGSLVYYLFKESKPKVLNRIVNI